MVLAQLRAGTDVLGRRSVTFRAQRHGEQLRPRDRIGRGDHCGPVPTDQVGHSTLGERTDGLLTVTFREEAQGGDRQIIVGVLELGPAGRSEQKHLRWTTPAPRPPVRRRAVGGLPTSEQRVEVAAHGGGAQPERVGNLTGCHGTALQ